MRAAYALLISLSFLACGEEPIGDEGFEMCGQWPRSVLPLAIVADPSARGIHTEIETATSRWQDVSPQLLIFLGELEDASGSVVSIVMTTDVDRGEAHKTLRDCEIIGATIYIPFGSRRLVRRLGHEIGHVFNLAHDTSRTSIMNPDSENGGAEILSGDRERLLDRYIR